METIRQQFEQTLQLLRLLLDKISERKFPTEDECYSIMERLDTLVATRTSGIESLQNSGVDDVDYSYISSLEELQQAQEAQTTRRRSIETTVRTFLSIDCVDDEHRDALARCQDELAACNEQELLARGRRGELEPYRILTSWVRNGRPGQEQEKMVKRAFGYQIAYALLDRKLCLPGEQAAGEPQQDLSAPGESSEPPIRSSAPVPEEDTLPPAPPEAVPEEIPAHEPPAEDKPARGSDPETPTDLQPPETAPAAPPEQPQEDLQQPASTVETSPEPVPAPEREEESVPLPAPGEEIPPVEPAPAPDEKADPDPLHPEPVGREETAPGQTPLAAAEEPVIPQPHAPDTATQESAAQTPEGEITPEPSEPSAQPEEEPAPEESAPQNPEAAPPANPESASQPAPLLQTTPPVLNDVPYNERRFRKQLDTLSVLSCNILLLMSQLGVADEETLASFRTAIAPGEESRDPSFLTRIHEELDTMVREDMAVRYTTRSGASFYCLTSYSLSALRSPSIVRELARVSPLTAGVNPLAAHPDVDVPSLLRDLERNRLVAMYMLFLQYMLDGPKNLSRRVRSGMISSLSWKDGTYSVQVPTSELPIVSTIRFERSDPPPKNSVLYLADPLPSVPSHPSNAVYGFVPGQGMHLLRGTRWVPLRSLMWVKDGVFPWKEGTLEDILTKRLRETEAPALGLPVESEPTPTEEQVSLPGFEPLPAVSQGSSSEESGIAGEDAGQVNKGPAADVSSSADSQPAAPAPEVSPQVPQSHSGHPEEQAALSPREETLPESPAEDMDLLPDLDAQGCARVILEQTDPVRPRQLMGLTVHLIAENALPEACAMAEVLASAPGEGFAVYRHFYPILCQSIRMPGLDFSWSSSTIKEQQDGLGDGDPRLQTLEQTMILSNLLWAMAFPSSPFDHDLYNMASGLPIPDNLQQLVSLFSGPLKEISFQIDGLGFSPDTLRNLAGDDARSTALQDLQKTADTLRATPTTSISLYGLDLCLKLLVGPGSVIGSFIGQIASGERLDVAQCKSALRDLLGPEDTDLDRRLEDYIDRTWTEIRIKNSIVKIKHLENDSPARKTCKRAISERLNVIQKWMDLQGGEPASDAALPRDRLARLLGQIRSLLRTVAAEVLPDTSPYGRAGTLILQRTARQMLKVLEGDPAPEYRDFHFSLCLTPELMLGESGENRIIPDFYHLKGLEPWTFLVRAIAQDREEPAHILSQIENYENKKWYRNYGTAELIRTHLNLDHPDCSIGIQNAERAAQLDVDNFQSETRLNRAYGKIREQTMETVFSALELGQKVCFRNHNFASFSIFLSRLREFLNRDISAQAAAYEAQYAELASDGNYAGLPLLESIRRVLDSQNFITADSYINQLRCGVKELPASEQTPDSQEDFLSQFLSLEKGYYQECRAHDTDNPSKWGEHALESLGADYCHWTSDSEKQRGLEWLNNWPMRKNSGNTRVRIQELLSGLGFQVRTVNLSTDSRFRRPTEVYTVSAEKTPTNLKEYPHPIYKFGTDLCDPIYVVFLPNCKGESTLISLMNSDAAPNGSTIVLMDGSLTSTARHTVALTFKKNTSRQYPFLFIDRVLLLYLASLNGGDRMKALLRCTLPYTFDLLYSNGAGAIPDEMFIGRTREVCQLCDLQGPNLVYGGRQLGKTALLTRASKILHDPENRDFSFRIDLKDTGAATLLDKVSKALLRLNLREQPCHTIQELCGALQTLYEGNRIRRMCIFVDESDTLFEEFGKENYAPVRPIITLRDQTKHHVKFVFAGTHNIAAMDTAAANNSNLKHLGPGLCIGPMTARDATRLIRIPMGYLGFQIGDSQIDLILSNTSSYPGLIQFFCRTLINSVCRDFNSYYAAVIPGHNPPYAITDEQMRAVFREKDIRREIGNMIISTISLNSYYRVLSSMLAHMTYEDQEKGISRPFGYSAKDLRRYNRQELHLTILSGLSDNDLTVLLDEMVKMNILWKSPETGEYRFQQRDFLNYIGNGDEVLGLLLKENEAQSDQEQEEGGPP